MHLGSHAVDIEYGLSDPPSSASPAPTLPLHRREPGVLLFRKARDKTDLDRRQQLLVLLVVGETSTEGLHKVAFRRALDLVDRYQPLDHHIVEDLRILGMTNLISLDLVGPVDEVLRRIVPKRIRILGPSFTGTENSMSYVIKQWSHKKRGRPLTLSPLEFLVVSGSASKVNAEKFAEDCGAEVGQLDFRFQATVHHSDLVVKRLLDYLRDLNGGTPLGRIALLTESDTEFGQSTTEKEFDHFGYDVTDMKFPFHISQVAVAYDRRPHASSQRQTAPIHPSNKLSIPFDETGHPRDIVPALASHDGRDRRIRDVEDPRNDCQRGLPVCGDRGDRHARHHLSRGLDPRVLPGRSDLHDLRGYAFGASRVRGRASGSSDGLDVSVVLSRSAPGSSALGRPPAPSVFPGREPGVVQRDTSLAG